MAGKIAIIKTGGKQYKVSAGQQLEVEKLDVNEGDSVKFDTLLVSGEDGNDLEVGNPSLGEKVEAKVIEQGRSEKKEFAKFKNKTRYLKKMGHKQPYTKVDIQKIA